MATIVNPEYKYKETRKPNTILTSSRTMTGFDVNPITGLAPSTWSPSSVLKYASLPISNRGNVFTPNHGE